MVHQDRAEELARLTGPLAQAVVSTAMATGRAHAQFLALHQRGTEAIQQSLAFQTSLLHQDPNSAALPAPFPVSAPAPAVSAAPALQERPRKPCVLDREQCLEFAIGKIGNVLGEAFAGADSFPTRVRLPDEPLMLVDRILSIGGEAKSMTSGTVVTEHDILPGAWYLDCGTIPTCIAVEAGQADLFLSGYLGVDFVTRGEQCYRLLDAVVTFYQGLPGPGNTIHYDIAIDRFQRQGDVTLFFFRFEATVNGQPLLTMEKGCAGFFSAAQLAAGKGVVFTTLDKQPMPGVRPADWTDLVPMKRESYDDAQVAALRRGDLAACFGPEFNLPMRKPVGLPGGKMELVHRVLDLDPTGGRYGLGQIVGEADIHPDDWFITCHFVDDMVMPGTLMYECCCHTLRILLARMGWVGEEGEIGFEPKPGVHSTLKCRGQVLATTKKVQYEISIKELGYGPEPYCIADALMSADNHPIVQILNMSIRLRGTTRDKIESIWRGSGGGSRHELALRNGVTGRPAQRDLPPPAGPGAELRGSGGGSRHELALRNGVTGRPAKRDLPPPAGSGAEPQLQYRPALYDRNRILEFSIGKPSLAFGEPYKVFDSERVIARLPGPPYMFMDSVVDIRDGEPFVLKAGCEVVADYMVPPNEWYFTSNRQSSMSFAILLEAVLQPCGWMAGYLGSALRSKTDVSFRNLGGTATQHREVFPDTGLLTSTVKLTRTSESGGMIVQQYDLAVHNGRELVYSGTTSFGFFSKKALAEQVGVRGAKPYVVSTAELERARPLQNADAPGLELPDEMLKMFDQVDVFIPDGGTKGLGYIRGVKMVNPEEWFFKAHFYQDPVCPGSLGLESFLQLMKVVARDRWGHIRGLRYEPIGVGQEHTWAYRGQIVPTNKVVTVEANITAIDDEAHRLTANGYLMVDGLVIYQMDNFTMRLAPATR